MAAGKLMLAARRKPGLKPVEKRQVRKIANAVVNKRAEKKHYFNGGTLITASSSGNIVSLTGVPQATTASSDTTRDGDKFELAGGKLRLDINTASGDGTNVVRIILFQWLQDTTPVLADILLNLTSGWEYLADYNHDKRDHFKILSDRSYYFAEAANEGPIRKVTSQSWKVGKRKAVVNMQGGGVTGTNEVYMLALSDSTAVNHPTVEYAFHTFFYDI